MGAGEFGFPLSGSIGGTLQPNGPLSDWPSFYRERRIGHQLRLARDSELRAAWARVLARTDELRALFVDGRVTPSLIHGDLWEGNFATCFAAAGEGEGSDAAPASAVTVFDPAAYLAHHEAEWGMAWCAALTADFWAGYRELVPEAAGFEERRPLYELYHKLNHHNLFGGGYREEALKLMERLAEGGCG
jgi:fructosamine-3-kinase